HSDFLAFELERGGRHPALPVAVEHGHVRHRLRVAPVAGHDRKRHHVEPPRPALQRFVARDEQLPGKGSGRAHTSRLATLSAFSWMKSRRGSTTSPISRVKISSVTSASSTLTCSSTRLSGSSVVSHSCSAFISPRPL